MSEEILKSLKIVLLVEAVLFVVFGIFFTFFIDAYVELFMWPDLDPTAGRFIGVIFLSFAFVSVLVWREKEWERIELLVILNILITILGAITQIIGVFLDETGWAGWLNFGIMLTFFLLLLFYYILQIKKATRAS
jgi:tryptophan-rich sensory protein